MFRSSGMFGFAELAICLLCSPVGVFAIALSGLHLAKRQTKTRGPALGVASAALLGGVLCTLIAIGGYFYGNQQINMALANVDPDMRAEMQAYGDQEVKQALTLGCAFAGGPLFFGACAFLMALAKPRDASENEAL